MLNLKFIQENKETVIERLAVKNFDARESVEKIIALDNQRKSLQQEAEAKQAQMNIIAKEIGKLMQSGQKEAAEKARQETADLKSAIAGLNSRRTEVSNELTDILLRLPNMPHASVAKGKSEADNEIVKIVDNIPQKHENDLPHWELARKYDLIDFETGVKITGAGFPLYKGLGARLQRALINFFLDENIKAGYQEVQPPLMVNADSWLRNRTVTGQRRSDVLCQRRQSLSDPDCRSSGNQHLPRRHSGRRPATGKKYRLFRLFPPGSRFLRQRCKRIEPVTSIR